MYKLIFPAFILSRVKVKMAYASDKSSFNSSSDRSNDRNSPPSKPSQVKLFITSYSDEFFAERDWIRKQVLSHV